MGVQKHYKKRFTKKIVPKTFTKNSTKNPKPTFSRFLFNHVFGRFSMRGVQKHDKKISKKINLTLVLFRTLTHPPRGSPDLFFAGPLREVIDQLNEPSRICSSFLASQQIGGLHHQQLVL
jgi:hypothetical protein